MRFGRKEPNQDRLAGWACICLAVTLYLALIAYWIARSMRLFVSHEDMPRWEYVAAKSCQLALIAFFAYGLFRWVKGFIKDMKRNRK
jgi:hypothetical protein